jgi:hypothetical protein
LAVLGANTIWIETIDVALAVKVISTTEVALKGVKHTSQEISIGINSG